MGDGSATHIFTSAAIARVTSFHFAALYVFHLVMLADVIVIRGNFSFKMKWNVWLGTNDGEELRGRCDAKKKEKSEYEVVERMRRKWIDDEERKKRMTKIYRVIRQIKVLCDHHFSMVALSFSLTLSASFWLFVPVSLCHGHSSASGCVWPNKYIKSNRI